MPSSKKSAHGGFPAFFERLSVQEKIDFARHLAIVIKAGLPLVEGLKIIRNQITSKTLIEIVDRLIGDIEKGQSLADSLQAHQHIFGDFFINIIRVGETSGTLAQNLLYLADELKKAKVLRSKIRSAMVYPMVILIATLAITGFLTFVVFPKIIPVFTGLNIKLPATTRILIEVLNFTKQYGWELLVGGILLIVIFRLLIRLPVFKYFFDRSVFMVPVLSGLTININMANFTRILGLLLKSGIRIVEAVTITASTFNNLVYRRALANADENIRKGQQLAEYLSLNEKFFPILLCGMIKIGENTGNLEDNLFYLSEYYTEEVDNKVRNLTTLLEPVMLLFMGLFVGFVAISIITPIYSISQGLSQ
ncbi:MAG: type II secretion system F family protein [Candidatus Liptonbacteria bacterium]|nr:type II secretion system F family protein [Candidatus Liptonbacteria bacterium]